MILPGGGRPRKKDRAATATASILGLPAGWLAGAAQTECPDPERLAAELDARIMPYRLGDALPDDDLLFQTELIDGIDRLPPERRAAAARSAIRYPRGFWETSFDRIAPHLTQDDLLEAAHRIDPILLARQAGLFVRHLDRARLPEVFAAVLAVEPEWARGEGWPTWSASSTPARSSRPSRRPSPSAIRSTGCTPSAA
ncbi:hypothetical protein [Actinoplanes philippinensis]|uniref:hypothetical protein n=1 Tax=Actinoplanes philippinensis TaxID=35752 RepID=UPI0033E79293